MIYPSGQAPNPPHNIAKEDPHPREDPQKDPHSQKAPDPQPDVLAGGAPKVRLLHPQEFASLPGPLRLQPAGCQQEDSRAHLAHDHHNAGQQDVNGPVLVNVLGVVEGDTS